VRSIPPMEKVGFFAQDVSEPSLAFDEQVATKKLFGGPEGLEISVAEVDAGMGVGLRRMKALNRIDIASMWRAMIRGGKQGPSVELLAPRGVPSTQAADKLVAAGLSANGTAGDEGYRVSFTSGTSSTELVQYAVRALQAIGYQPTEWQWTVRAKGAYPR
jgi:hypothetical protein